MFYLKMLRKKVRPTVQRTFLKLKRFDVRNSIILVSEPRSGSTWLMEILAKHPRTIINWEPFHGKLGVLSAGFELGMRPDMQVIALNTNPRQMIEEVLTYRRCTGWTMKYLKANKVLFADTVLTKMVRGVRTLPWLVNEFDFIHKPIHLLRHPIPAVLSQVKNFDEILLKDVFRYLKNHYLNAETTSFLQSLQGQVEYRLALWCLFSKDVLAEDTTKWIRVYYEDIVRDPVKEISRINTECGLELQVDSIEFRKPSKTDFKNLFLKDVDQQLSKWMKEVTNTERDKMQQILDYFDIKVYSAHEIYPLH